MWSLLISKFQKGACRYLLHRYLGQYLREKVTVDQLTVDLFEGTGSVKDVSLDCDVSISSICIKLFKKYSFYVIYLFFFQALNSLAEQHNLPIEFVDGSLEEITFAVPWSTILQDSCEIQIKGLRIIIQPKNRIDPNGVGGVGGNGSGSMIDSMFTSMASSMQLAEECIKSSQDIEEDEQYSASGQGSEMSGLEHCAKTIDAGM